MKMTKQERIIRWLKDGRGMEEVEGRTSKYRVLRSRNEKGERFYFVGRNGALRACSTKAASKSTSISHLVDAKLASWEKENGL